MVEEYDGTRKTKWEKDVNKIKFVIATDVLIACR